MKTVSLEFARELIDFAPDEKQMAQGFSEMQLEGTVALFNMLARNRCAYLADEVGMGKTYVALGVMSLLRYLNPHARVLVIAPRENIQRKWIKELNNFVRNNWKVVGNRVKAIQGGAVWEPVYCNSLLDFSHEVLLNRDRDFFLRMSSFSLALKDPQRRVDLRKKLLTLVPWVGRGQIRNRTEDGFKDDFGCALNATLPEFDLVIFDEAHNLKHGYGPRVSTRNRVLAATLGHPSVKTDKCYWYGPRAKRVLLLSATPFEEDYSSLRRQFELFGFGDAVLRDADGKPLANMSSLDDNELSIDAKRDVVKLLMLRRVTELRIGGQSHTKNMYRQEWRRGGYQLHDQPMVIEDPKQRLIIGLMQKKVAEVLQDERFNNSFQIGMLSSFESFLESVQTAKRRKKRSAEEVEDSSEQIFDGHQDATNDEKQGIDSHAIGNVALSYRETFGSSLPHPKLDATAAALSKAFTTGDKSLVFVRRVRTVDELGGKLDGYFDQWIRLRMEHVLPKLTGEIDELFSDYERDRRRRPEDRLEHWDTDEGEPEPDDQREERKYIDEEDEGSAETFFSWFFRGQGPKGYLSGAAFQRDRLSSAGAIYSTLFEDDHVSWLLGHPIDPLNHMASVLDVSPSHLKGSLRSCAFGNFLSRRQQKGRYPRLYVFEAYQIAALSLLAKLENELGDNARAVLASRYPGGLMNPHPAPDGFPDPEEAIGVPTFFTELVKRPDLRSRIWPDEHIGDFLPQFKRREQRRELISAMARLGAAYIDLYLLAIAQVGSFIPKERGARRRQDDDLVQDFLDLLEAQMNKQEFCACHELSHAAEAFDLIVATNFPEVPAADLSDLPRIYAATLRRQVPVGRMSGGVNKQLVRQFRMPGFPLVLISTDVLQEGEDLHTFCRNVVHYGIAWTPSAIEQRTGRIDRIGSLVQRQIDGRDSLPTKDELIQVYYPYLQETVEVLQVRRVLRRLNRFLHLVHKRQESGEDTDSRLNAAEEILGELTDIPAVEGLLESAFPVGSDWLGGQLSKEDAQCPDVGTYLRHLEKVWNVAKKQFALEEIATNSPCIRSASAIVSEGVVQRKKPIDEGFEKEQFRLELRSQAAGDSVLLRCISMVTSINRHDDAIIDLLAELQTELGYLKICVRPGNRTNEDLVSIERDIVFHPKTTQPEELDWVIETSVLGAKQLRDAIHAEYEGFY